MYSTLTTVCKQYTEGLFIVSGRIKPISLVNEYNNLIGHLVWTLDPQANAVLSWLTVCVYKSSSGSPVTQLCHTVYIYK